MGLFTRLGTIFAAQRNVNGFRGTTAPASSTTWGSGGQTIRAIATSVNNIEAQYASTRQDLIDALYTQREAYRGAHGSFQSYLKTLCEQTLIEMSNDDSKLPSKSVLNAMTNLVAQMIANSNTITYNTVSVTPSAGGSNVGNAQFVASIIDKDGKNLEYVFPETIIAKVTSDALLGATAGSEPLSFAAPAQRSDTLYWDWPAGSGAVGTLAVVDPTIDIGTNILRNSDFETFTSNVPDYWTSLVGVPGTDTLKDVSNTYDSSAACLEFAGDGATLSSVAQTFGSSSGTTYTLKPLTVYAFNAFVKMSADNNAGAGVLSFALVDSSNTIINDQQGTANNKTYALNIASTSYIAVNGFFRTPANLPSTVKLRVRLSTALTSGKNVFIDHLAMTPATQLYTGGPWAAVFRGSTDVLKDDYWSVAVANDQAGVFQTMFERVFGMRALNLKIPSASSGSIADTLVTA